MRCWRMYVDIFARNLSMITLVYKDWRTFSKSMQSLLDNDRLVSIPGTSDYPEDDNSSTWSTDTNILRQSFNNNSDSHFSTLERDKNKENEPHQKTISSRLNDKIPTFSKIFLSGSPTEILLNPEMLFSEVSCSRKVCQILTTTHLYLNQVPNPHSSQIPSVPIHSTNSNRIRVFIPRTPTIAPQPLSLNPPPSINHLR